jgi:hypothetical protein
MAVSSTADATGRRDIDALRAANDRSLWRLIAASSDQDRAAEIETLLTAQVQPVIRKVVAQRQYGVLRPHDAEDIASSVLLRVLRRLQRVPFDVSERIERLHEFASSSTLNAIRDFMRVHFPERARMKDRVRYILGRDRRFRTWPTAAGTACGLASWPEAMPTGQLRSNAHPDPMRTAEAIESLLQAAGAPLLVGDIVDALSETRRGREERFVESAEVGDRLVSHALRLETRQRLTVLWRETCALPPQQRAALLLNLRDGDGDNAIALFSLLGIASLDDVAAAIDLPLSQLARLWPRLPLDDLSIAELLGVTRQQVINLRLSARQRLARRMRKR